MEKGVVHHDYHARDPAMTKNMVIPWATADCRSPPTDARSAHMPYV